MQRRSPRLARVLLSALAASATVYAASEAMPGATPQSASPLPPGGLSPRQVPQFVSFGSDDNPYSGLPASGGGGGLHYLTELFASRRNPAGDGDTRTFDGRPPHYSFYVNTKYITAEGEEDPALVKESWREAIEHGHEIGVHTHSHPHGQAFGVDEWGHEIRLCIDHLTDASGLAVPRAQLIGFRTPFLEYGDATFTAARRAGFSYDTSIEEGFQEDQDGRDFLWPYTLDHGSPGNSATYERLSLPLVREHPGLWELPVYAFVVPPDELCERYGVAPGFRARMKQKNDYFEVDQGKVTGMDWNLWFEYGMSKAEALATLEYTLDLHLQGNRCPLTVGLHSGIYADRSPEQPPGASVRERRDALAAFLDYALSKPEVRVASARELLDWIRSPVPLATPARTSAAPADESPQRAPKAAASPAPTRLAAGFRFSTYGPDYDPGPAYWKSVGERMAQRFPGSVPGAVWIVGRLKGQGCELSFPGQSSDPLIQFTKEDGNEATLDLFDAAGYEVWLQVEPGNAPVEKLIDLVLARYGRHPSVVGVGVDVEWYRSVDEPDGQAVTDAEARAWLKAVRAHDPRYRLFLKHWLVAKMPKTAREGLTFIDDSQILPSLDAMVDEFAGWAKAFAPAPVGFQFGYDTDRPWWEKLQDPPAEIGRRILEAAPNTAGLYWVDFSVLDVFPPEQLTGASPAAPPPTPLIGVKIYRHDGELDPLFRSFDELGIGAVFASEALAEAPGFRAKAREHGVDLFLIEPVFYNPEAVKQDPTLVAITAQGTPARDEWVEFVCPSRPEYRARRVREIAEAVKRIRPDGLSLDFLRHFVFWEKVPIAAAHDSFPNTCFCDRCVVAFARKAGLTIPPEAVGNPRAAASWILAGHEAAWTEWKVDLIDSMTAELVAAARKEKPDLEVALHAVPWRRHDYGGAVLRIAGQDDERLGKRLDYLSPMTYSHMLRRPPRWIRSVVRTLAATSQARILPSIQVQEAYRPGEPLSADEFAEELREALRPPSAGVVLWSWDGLSAEPEKQRALRAVLAERAAAPRAGGSTSARP
jgi:Polysaccharide deacetylase